MLNTTKLDYTNVQQYGLTRDRLTTDTAYAVCANDSLGVLSVVAPLTNTAVYYNASARATAGTLPTLVGGTGLSFSVTSADITKVLGVNTAGTGLTLSVLLDPGSLVYKFYKFT